MNVFQSYKVFQIYGKKNTVSEGTDYSEGNSQILGTHSSLLLV